MGKIVRYEKLPNICFNCGRLGHAVRDRVDGSMDPKNPKYGIWLRASPWRSVKNYKKEINDESDISCPTTRKIFFTKCMEPRTHVDSEVINNVASLLNRVSFDDNLECKNDGVGLSDSVVCPRDCVEEVVNAVNNISGSEAHVDDNSHGLAVIVLGETVSDKINGEGPKMRRKKWNKVV